MLRAEATWKIGYGIRDGKCSRNAFTTPWHVLSKEKLRKSLFHHLDFYLRNKKKKIIIILQQQQQQPSLKTIIYRIWILAHYYTKTKNNKKNKKWKKKDVMYQTNRSRVCVWAFPSPLPPRVRADRRGRGEEEKEEDEGAAKWWCREKMLELLELSASLTSALRV